MSTQQINGSSVTKNSTKNNAGVVSSLGGNVSGTFTPIKVTSDHSGVFASTIVDNDNIDPALQGGTFAKQNKQPITFKVTKDLAGEETNAMSTSADDVQNARSINRQLINDSGSYTDGVRTSLTTSAIRNGKFDIYSGKFDNGYPLSSLDAFTGADSASGDKAATVNRQEPGTLVYKTTKGSPITQSYDEKTG